MPLYDARNQRPGVVDPFPETPLPGSVPFPAGWNGTMDANGNPLSPLLWCNTETGAVGRYDVRDGKWQTDPVTGRVVVLNETHPAPLRQTPPADVRAGASALTRVWFAKVAAARETATVLNLTDPPADDADDKDDTDLFTPGDDADPPHVVGG